MNRKYLQFASDLLRLASNEFSNHGCNDLAYPLSWTTDDQSAFAKELSNWAEERTSPQDVPDYLAMEFLAHALSEAADPYAPLKPGRRAQP